MRSPILFLIFKRPDTTMRVFDRIREVQPPRLYIAADGPRESRPGEKELCEETRRIVENIDWPCEVHRLYRDHNLGCGKGVSTAISWFFENEQEGIIIEDDVLAHPDFFLYCDEMLEKYRDDSRIQLIAGRNSFFKPRHHAVSYYMSDYMMIWGWATWRRVWNTYQFDVSSINELEYRKAVESKYGPKTRDFFYRIYQSMLKEEIDTWDHQFFINQVIYNRFTILPYINMVENLGLNSPGATHTGGRDYVKSQHKAETPYPLIHPDLFFQDKESDYIHARGEGIIPPSYKKITRFVRRYLSKLFH